MPTRAEARASALDELERRERKRNADRPEEVPTVASYFYQCLAGPLQRLADNTWELYDGIYRTHVELDPFGLMRIDHVRPHHVEAWSVSLKTAPRLRQDGSIRVPARPVSKSTQLRYIGCLSGIFERARVLHHHIEVNPVHDCPKPRPEQVEFRILTAVEVEQLLGHADGWQQSHNAAEGEYSRAGMIVLLGLHGLGPAEMAGLKRSDFDGEGITVRSQAQNGKVMATLKTDRRLRWVPVDDELAQRIRQVSTGFLLQTEGGRPMLEQNIRQTFARFTKGTPFEGMKPYDLRHTCAMRLLEEGVDARTVAEILGNTPTVVLQSYARSRPDLKRAAIAKLRRKSA